MNAEKELLLSLLIEKYAVKKNDVVVYETVNQRVDRFVAFNNKKRRNSPHAWTAAEKEFLLEARKQGMGWSGIIKQLQLSKSQVSSMHYCLTHRKNKAVK
jgi:hypothetical protein